MGKIKRNSREEALKSEAQAYLLKLRAKLTECEHIDHKIQKAKELKEVSAIKQAQAYKELLSERAQFRQTLKAKAIKQWQVQSLFIERQAQAYKKHLQRYLHPGQAIEIQRTTEMQVVNRAQHTKDLVFLPSQSIVAFSQRDEALVNNRIHQVLANFKQAGAGLINQGRIIADLVEYTGLGVNITDKADGTSQGNQNPNTASGADAAALT